HDEITLRIVSERLEGVHLLRHFHRAKLGGHTGADAAGERESGQHRPQLQHHRLADERTHEVERDRAGEGVRGLEGEHDAGKGRNEERYGERIDTDSAHLADQQPRPDSEVGEGAPHVYQKVAKPPDGLDSRDGATAYSLNHGKQKWPGFLLATRGRTRRLDV